MKTGNSGKKIQSYFWSYCWIFEKANPKTVDICCYKGTSSLDFNRRNDLTQLKIAAFFSKSRYIHFYSLSEKI